MFWLTEVGVALRLSCGEPLLVIVSQKLVQEINGFIRNVSLVLRGDESRPGLLWVTASKKVSAGKSPTAR